MMEYEKALKIAESLVEFLRPACTRIEIAGSIRRGKKDVKDIEIVAMPDLAPPPRARPEFGKPIPVAYKTMLDKLVAEMVGNGQARILKSGDKYKQLALPEEINLDLFLVTPPATWGVLFTLRTGPADFSHWLVTKKRVGGALPNGYQVQDGAVWRGENEVTKGDFVGFAEERDFLNFLGLGWVEPGERVEKWR